METPKLLKKIRSYLLIITLIMTFLPPKVSEAITTEVNLESVVNQTEPKEIEHLRTEFSKTYKNKDGSLTNKIYQYPIHFKDNASKLWKEIENNFELDTTNSDIVNYENSFKVKFKKNTNAGESLLKVSQNEKVFALNPVSQEQLIENNFIENRRNNIEATFTGNKITYSNIYPYTDITYQLGSSKVKEDIIIKKRPSAGDPVQFSFELSLNGLDVIESSNGEIQIIDPITKEVQYYLEKPFMFDSYMPEGYKKTPNVEDIPEAALSFDVQYKLVKRNNKWFIDVIPNREWLESNDRVYPVTIDPTIVTYQPKSQLEDTNIRSFYPDQTGGTETTLGVGLYKTSTQTNVIRSLFKFDVSSIPVGSKIIAADLNLWIASVYNNTLIDIDLHELSNTWTEAGATWKSRNGSTAWLTQGSDYTSTILSSDKVSDHTDLSISHVWDVPSETVQKWVGNPAANKGLLLKSKDETVQTYKKFISGDHADINGTNYSPVLVVSYYPISRLGFEDYWSYETFPAGNGTAAVNVATGNNTVQSTDIFVEGIAGTSMGFTRTYNSKSVDDSPLGYGWTFTGNESIIEDWTENEAYYTDSDGTSHFFKYDSVTGKYTSPPGVYLTLSKTTDGYLLTDKYGVKTYFKTFGNWNGTIFHSIRQARIDSIVDRNGNKVTYNFDSTTGRLMYILDPSNRKIVFEYNTSGKISSVRYETIEGTQSKFEYHYLNGKLEKVIEHNLAGGTSVTVATYVYNSENRVQTVTNANNRKVDFSYNGSFLTKVQLPDVNDLHGDGSLKDLSTRPGYQFAINDATNTTIITDPKLNKTTYNFNSDYVVTKITDSATGVTQFNNLDANYNPQQIIDPMGYITNRTFDTQGNLKTITDPEVNITSFNYNSYSQLLDVTNPEGKITKYQYDTRGNLQQITDPNSQVTQYQYDYELDGTGPGNIREVFYPNGAKLTYNYTNDKVYVNSVTDPNGKVVFGAQVNAFGNITEFTNGNQNKTSFALDYKQDLKNVTIPVDNPTNYDYDNVGNVKTITNGNKAITKFDYSGQNLVKAVTDALQNPTLYS